MGRILGGKGRVVCLISFFNPSASANRRNGFLDTLKNLYPGIEVVNEYEYLDSDELAYESLKSASRQSERIDGIFGNSATGTVAAALFAETLPAIERPAVIGYDVTAEVERLLKAGVCTMIIDQDPRKQSYFGVKLLARHLTEKWVPKCPELEIRVKLVMRYNAQDHTMEQDLKGNILA
jgi:ribose transport system substrate-binding protein